MKKAKILLAAAAVVAVVGGSLAFKASKMTDTPYYTFTKVGISGECTLEGEGLYTTVPQSEWNTAHKATFSFSPIIGTSITTCETYTTAGL